MQIIVVAGELEREEFEGKKINNNTQIIYVNSITELSNYDTADAFIIIKEEIIQEDFKGKPVLINSTIHTLHERQLPENFIRFNGWPTFLKQQNWEVATKNKDALHILQKLEWDYTEVLDEPGLVSGRIISMIINEAYFALGENVSTKEEIDIAMKLGTNYPYGPFEWCRKIGIKNVYGLLEKLSETDSRYTISPAMKNEFISYN